MKKLLSLCAFLCLGTLVSGQYNLDYGFKLGGANYLGEIGGKDKTRRDFVWDMKLKQSSFALGGFIRYKLSPVISASFSLTYGRIRGADSLSENKPRVGRNLSFRNDIFDITTRGEFYVISANDVGNRGRYRTDFKAFLFAGVSAFHHNPKARNASYNGGAWTALQPLNTQNLDKPYSLWSVSLPTGIGMYFTHRRKHRIGWEIGWHTTFTDHLDDAGKEFYPDVNTMDAEVYNAFTMRSDEVDPADLPLGGIDNYGGTEDKRADPSHNDTYLFTAFTYSYVVRGPNSFYRQHYGWLSNRKGRYKRRVRAKF